jgi:hypothetical protein
MRMPVYPAACDPAYPVTAIGYKQYKQDRKRQDKQDKVFTSFYYHYCNRSLKSIISRK